MSVTAQLADHVRLRPDYPAVEQGDRIVSYRKFGVLVDRIRANLQSLDCKQGDAIGLCLPNSIEHLALIWAIAKQGWVVCPIRMGTQVSSVSSVVNALDIRYLVTEEPGFVIDGVKLVSLSALLVSTSSSTLRESPAGPDDPLLVSYSSGTTGKPKLFLSSHYQVGQYALEYANILHWDESDRIYFNMDMGDSWGCSICLNMIMLGITMVLPADETAQASINYIRNKVITVAIFLPWQIRIYLSFANPDEMMFPTLKSVMTSGSLLPGNEKALFKKYISPYLYDAYGTTEVPHVAVADPETQEQYPDSVGKVVSGVDLEIVDQNHLPVEAGRIGFIRVRSSYMIERYINDPESSQRCFRDGWFYPMDLGYVNKQGYLFLMGRSDDVIDCKGAKFFPAEVENVLSSSPDVRECAVFGWPDKQVGEVAAAAVVCHSGTDAQQLKLFCEERLEHYKVPEYFLFLDSIPKKASMKIDRKAVGALLADSLGKRQIN